MVVDELSDEEIDRIFHALADATRRDIVRRVLVAEESVSGLAQRYTMSFAAVQKHVAVLERAGLVSKRSRGRERMVQGNVTAIEKANRLLEQYQQIWAHRVRTIEDILMQDEGDTPK